MKGIQPRSPLGFWAMHGNCSKTGKGVHARVTHTHVKLEGGKAKDAALYTDEPCQTICGGLRKQIGYDDKNLKCVGTMD